MVRAYPVDRVSGILNGYKDKRRWCELYCCYAATVCFFFDFLYKLLSTTEVMLLEKSLSNYWLGHVHTIEPNENVTDKHCTCYRFSSFFELSACISSNWVTCVFFPNEYYLSSN